MKLNKKTLLTVGVATVLATLALATFTAASRLRDGGSNGVGYVTYARDSAPARFAFLKKDPSTNTYQVYVAGPGVTGDQLCSSGLYSCTRPSISRDGKIVTYWAAVNGTTNRELRAAYYIVNGSGPVLMSTAYTTTLNTSDNNPEWWPPQATNIRTSDSSFRILFKNMKVAATVPEANCTTNAGNPMWLNGQLYLWDGGGGYTVVSTKDNNVDGCQYLVTQGPPGDFGNTDSPAQCNYYTISNATNSIDHYQITWSAKAINQLSTVTQNNAQIIWLDLNSGSRELISKKSTGAEGNGDSIQQSMTGDSDIVAFASLATNLTSYTGDTNGKYDIFRRHRSANTTKAGYNLALNNTGSLSDGDCYYPVVTGNGSFVAFHTFSTGLATYSSSKPYPIGATPFCFMSRFPSDPGSTELASYLAATPTNWRTGLFPSVNLNGSQYGFHSIEGDIASPAQTGGITDIYEMTGFF